ncbi:MAG: DNA replication/repair protein RecF [Gammaproteobacteria bacterium]|nr:DNA replication/repair protein RecF [Gammaproteobacteria bacterium]
MPSVAFLETPPQPMHIEWLHVRNVRNLSELRIEPAPGLNLVCGPNGSGKTALLEAIYFLGRCRSFRTAAIQRVIRNQQRELQVSAGLLFTDQRRIVTGVERSRTALNIRYNNTTVHKVSEQAAQLPIITIIPESHRLVSGSPIYRRRWLDWAMFHVEPHYINLWRDYYKALKHRNSLLRSNRIEQLGVWEQAMARAAEAMTAQRTAFINELATAMSAAARRLQITQTTLEYECGWQADMELASFLAKQRKGDQERGTTRQGLHRSDMTIRHEGREVGHFYSRGQIKLCIIALSLALDSVFRKRTGRIPVILADDLPAELDGEGLLRVVGGLVGQGSQVFITSTDLIPGVSQQPLKLFHVEQGRITDPVTGI